MWEFNRGADRDHSTCVIDNLNGAVSLLKSFGHIGGGEDLRHGHFPSVGLTPVVCLIFSFYQIVLTFVMTDIAFHRRATSDGYANRELVDFSGLM